MTTFLLLFLVFVAVVLIMLSLYWAWLNLFDPRNKAKKERLRTIHDAVHSNEQSRGSAIVAQSGNELETWLRAHAKTFVWLENLIKRARIPLTASRLAILMLGLFSVVLALGLLLQTNPLTLFPLAVAVASAPVLLLLRKAGKRGKVFGDRLPETLDYISRALRASHSLNTALTMVGKEFPDPIGTEFKVVSDKISFGIPFKDAIVRRQPHRTARRTGQHHAPAHQTARQNPYGLGRRARISLGVGQFAICDYRYPCARKSWLHLDTLDYSTRPQPLAHRLRIYDRWSLGA
jgi:tight adherence protein B